MVQVDCLKVKLTIIITLRTEEVAVAILAVKTHNPWGWILQIIGHCYKTVICTRCWILATIIWLKPGCSCVPRAAAAASLKARRPQQPLPDDSCLVSSGLISQASSNFLVILGHFFGLQVPQFSNVSNICLKCQLISIYQQRGIKLTCAAGEPATTTA